MLAGSSGSFIRSDELALALIDAVQNRGDDLVASGATASRSAAD
jgi:hypothetical protein